MAGKEWKAAKSSDEGKWTRQWGGAKMETAFYKDFTVSSFLIQWSEPSVATVEKTQERNWGGSFTLKV